MRRFWDRRAQENAFFFVDSSQAYRDTDVEAFWEGGERALDWLLGSVAVEIAAADRVVEIGCGVGRLTRVLAGRASEVKALDVSARMIERAREHNAGLANVDWLVGDGATLAGVDDGWADACVSHIVFQHIPDPEITLSYVRDMGRVLRPGGVAAFQVSNDPALHRRERWSRTFGDRLRALARRRPRGVAEAPWLGSAVSIAGLRRAANAGGMDLERVENEGTQYCFIRARRR